MRHVVLGYDGSTFSKKGLEEIISLAKGFPDLHASIVLVIPYNQAEDEAVDLTGKFSKTNDERIRSIEADFQPLKEHGISYSAELMIGNPSEKLIEFAKVKQADLIMVGHRGLNPIKEAFVGSVSRKVIRESPVSVYVIK